MSPASLPDVLDQQREEDRRRCVRALLRHPLLTPDGPDQQAFTLARRHAAWLGDWFASQAGWTLYADHAVVRLRKVPGELSDASRGAAARLPACLNQIFACCSRELFFGTYATPIQKTAKKRPSQIGMRSPKGFL